MVVFVYDTLFAIHAVCRCVSKCVVDDAQRASTPSTQHDGCGALSVCARYAMCVCEFPIRRVNRLVYVDLFIFNSGEMSLGSVCDATCCAARFSCVCVWENDFYFVCFSCTFPVYVWLRRNSFDIDLKNVPPWSTSNWSHTDLNRLRAGRVSAQVN